VHRIDPTVDVVFKAILGSEHHLNLLINFLNAILGLKGSQRVNSVSIRNPFNIKNYLQGKVSVVDVKAVDQLDRDFQVEIQIGSHAALLERMLFNWAGLYFAKIDEGEDYALLKPVISIWLLVDDMPGLPVRLPGFPLINKEDKVVGAAGKKLDYSERRKTNLVHVPFAIFSREANLYLSNHFAIHAIQLMKQAEDVKIEGDKDCWISFFRNGKELDPNNLPPGMNTPVMREAMAITMSFSEKEENYHLYLSRFNERLEKKTRQSEYANALIREAFERTEKEQALKDKERERTEKEQALKEKARERDAKEQALKEKARERDAKEQALKEKARERTEKEQALMETEHERAAKEQALADRERLIRLLKKTGIDPNIG